jgi:GTP-binding protein
VNPFRVVICGRPNVGKSSLFNAVLRRRVAIVDPTAGVTRDRVEARVERPGGSFFLMDTGGIGQFDNALLKDEIERQIQYALQDADLIVLVVDAGDGCLPADAEIARRLRHLDKPVVLVANKCDGVQQERASADFMRLGFGAPIAVSARERYGVEELVETILERMPEDAGEEPEDPADGEAVVDDPNRPIRIAIVGKVNSGKSTLMNLLVGSERVIVSPLAGTTRDSIDAPFEWHGRKFIAVDTAGIRKHRAVDGTPDFYSQGRAEESIRRCDVVLFLIDATREISQIDKAIARTVADSARPVVLCITKWDLAQQAGKTPDEYEPYVHQQLHALAFAPVCFMSALTKFNVDAALKTAIDLYVQSSYRVGTGELNRVIEQSESRQVPRVGRGKFPKMYYATQTGVRPPTFVVFVNEGKLFGDEYARYMANRMRQCFPFGEVPLRVFFKERRRTEKGKPNRRSP